MIEADGNIYIEDLGMLEPHQLGLAGKLWLETPTKGATFDNETWEMSDPADILQALGRGKRSKWLGLSQIDGTKVTGYDITSAPASLPGSVQSYLRESTMQIRIDRSGLLRRFDVSLPSSSTPGATGTTMSMTLFDYGAPVKVLVPPQSEIASLQELSKSLGGGGTGVPSGFGSECKTSFYTNP